MTVLGEPRLPKHRAMIAAALLLLNLLVAGDYVVIPIEWDSFEALEDTVVLLTAAVQGTPD